MATVKETKQVTMPSSKKIIDFESIERYTECAFCLEQFKEPRILPCSHTYCTICLQRMSNGEAKVRCAQCLVEHPMQTSTRDSADSVLVFPKNLALQQLLDLKPTQLLSSNECDDCQVNYAFTKCFHCTKSICLECSRAHRVHFKNDLNQLFNCLVDTCNSIIDNINTDINEFLLDCNKTKLTISNCVESLVNSLKLKESKLHQEIDTIINEKMCSFSQMKHEISTESIDLKQFLEQSTQSIKDDTITDTDLCKFKTHGDKKHNALKQIENKLLRKKIRMEFSPCKTSIEHMVLGHLKLNEQQEEETSNAIPTKYHEQHSSTSSLPMLTPPQSPQSKAKAKTPAKTNLDLVKECGLWAGNETMEFWCPSGVAIHPHTYEIVIADSWNHRIQVRNPANTHMVCTIVSDNGTSSRANGEFNNPKDLVIDDCAKRLIVSDSGNNRVQVFDYDYAFIFKFGRYGFAKGELRNPVGVCVDRKSQIYVCDRDNHRVQVFDSAGKWLKDFGARGDLNGQFEFPEYLCISPLNYLLVSDTGNNRVQLFDLDGFDVGSAKFGSFMASFGGLGSADGLFWSPRGIATDSDGFIMVADSKNNRLQLFKPNGEFIRVINETCSNEFGKSIGFDRPVAICATSNGGLIITEWGRSHKVQIF